MNETNLAQLFKINFLIQFVSQQTIYIYIYIYIYIDRQIDTQIDRRRIDAMQMLDLYIMYIYIGVKVNHTSSKNAGQENPTW